MCVLCFTDTNLTIQCSTAPTVRGFVNNLFNLPTKVMVIGPDCSTSTQSVAELAPFWELVQVRVLLYSVRFINLMDVVIECA